MDNLTHAFAGCLIAVGAVAIVERRGAPASGSFRKAATAVAVIGAEIPDIDLAYAGRTLDHGQIAYLLHHRGYTHTILFAIVSALFLWLVALALNREARTAPYRWPLLTIALIATLSHIALDYTNSYGVHPFWPVHNAWHYGDAVFIIEPWLWVASLPPLLFAVRHRGAQFLFGASLAGILAAAWSLSVVGRGVALCLTIGAVVWLLVMYRCRSNRRVAGGIVAWCAIELLFFASSRTARAAVREVVPAATLRDVALTPVVGNPFCFRAQVVELTGDGYRVTAVTVAPFPVVQTADQCGGGSSRASAKGSGRGDDSGGDHSGGSTLRNVPAPLDRHSTSSVHWGREWSASRADLVALVADNCDVATVLRFMRVPFWQREANGVVRVFDLRFGEFGGFAGIRTTEHKAGCANAPAWTPPRQDILGAQ